jgi:hypothetical protein
VGSRRRSGRETDGGGRDGRLDLANRKDLDAAVVEHVEWVEE